MPSKTVYAEVSHDGPVIRIFKNRKEACGDPAWDELRVVEAPKGEAVGAIRRQVFDRADYKCEHCGRDVIWPRGYHNSGEMNEKHSKGRGGEVSVSNGELLCRGCHRTGPNAVHPGVHRGNKA